METSLRGTEETLLLCDVARKRSIDKKSDDDAGSLASTSKHITAGCEQQTTENDTSCMTSKAALKQGPRKRKYTFNSDFTSSRKSMKYYYLSESMTKPRRPKFIQVETEEKKPEVTDKRHKTYCVRVNSDGHLYLMQRLSSGRFDMFFNNEKRNNYESFKCLDLAFNIVDEIALEGLDGITIEAFWKRLRNVFPNNLSKAMMERIWRLICNNKHINFYILKEPRDELVFMDRCKFVNSEADALVEPFIETNEIYPLVMVCASEIRGSCSTFHSRKENNGVRKFSLEKAIKHYDRKLVFTADQSLRNKALINEEADPNLELQHVEYCMLEKIGRTRTQGEFTPCKMPSSKERKKFYHNKKILSQNFLIVNQNFNFKALPNQPNVSGGLVHLPRFYNRRKTKQFAIMQRLAQILQTRPNHDMQITEFREAFGGSIFVKKLLNSADFRKFFRIYTYPYRTLHPNASRQDYLHKNKITERQIRVIKLMDRRLNITALMESKYSKENILEKEAAKGSPGFKLMNYDYLKDVFLFILSSGSVGVTLLEIFERFKTDYYSVRLALRKLFMRNVIYSSKIDMGRQQSLKFIAKCVSTPGVQIETQPKTYHPSDETLQRVLKGYENIDSANFYSEPETKHPVPVQTEFKLDLTPFYCSAFLTETDASPDEQTIYDIVIKGRDKLLLIQSNLFTHYLSEWDEFLLKRESFSKGIQLLQDGFGKVIYDFLATIRISDNFQVDNGIIFSMNNLNSDTVVGHQFHPQNLMNLPKNYKHPHSNHFHVDVIGKVYVFDAMFNEHRKTVQCVEKAKNIFERLMISERKRKKSLQESVITTELDSEVDVSSELATGKLMGSQPVLQWSTRESDITTQVFASSEPREIVTRNRFATDDINFTQRYINRANIILKMVYEKKVVQEVVPVHKAVLEVEDHEGYGKKACKKSIVSIISRLIADGYFKCYMIVMSGKNIVRTQQFLCVHDVNSEHPLIKTTVEQMKMKFYVGTATQKLAMQKVVESPFSLNDVKQSIQELNQLTSSFSTKRNFSYKFSRNKGKDYGYAPKFVRMRVLHEHLFYVIRELQETEPLTTRQVFSICKNLKIKLSPNELNEMPPVYRSDVSWQMFIPPLPHQTLWPKGWALACNVILRMPLSIFVRLVCVNYAVPELEEYLKHPLKKHFLIKYLPVNVRNVLLHKRKYFHSIYETITNLCYIGVLQLGPRSSKEKDQLILYVNLKAKLYDTCSSEPGYNHIEDKFYKPMSFEFRTLNDLEIYWAEMLRICMNTQLGKRKMLDGQLVCIEYCDSKPCMRETLKARTFDGAVKNDNGEIPGDGSGSAGFDSSLWMFVKRNWMWRVQRDKGKKEIAKKETKIEFVTKARKKEKLMSAKKFSKKKCVRKIVARRKEKVRVYCDAVDRDIMLKNTGIKVDWNEEEDQILRYFRVACRFLCPVFKKQFIPYHVLRDVLHRINRNSKDKTARAIQRRIYVLLINDESIRIMESNVENLLNSDTIAKYFEQIYKRYQNGLKISDNQMSVLFVYLMSYIIKHKKEMELLLLGHFATFDFLSEANISESESFLQNFDEKAKIIYPNPNTVEDIQQDTIKSVIHCSMSCHKHSVGWTLYLSKIYSRYKDELIRSTLSSMRKNQFLVLNKNHETKSLDSTFPSPIKFSHVYKLSKTSSYPIEMYRDSFEKFVSLIHNATPQVISFIDCNELNSFWENTNLVFDIPEMGVILNPEIEDHSEVIDELAKRFLLYLQQVYQKNEGKKTPSSKLDKQNQAEKNIDETKGEVRHLIFRLPYLLEGDLEDCFKHMLDATDGSEINKCIHQMIVNLKNVVRDCVSLEGLQDFIAGIDEDNVNDAHNLIKDLSKVVFAIQNEKILGYKTEESRIRSLENIFDVWEAEVWNEVRTKDYDKKHVVPRSLIAINHTSGMETCVKGAQTGVFPSLEEIKDGMMADFENSKTRRIPHITDLIMLLNEDRFPELDTGFEKVDKVKDHFIMQYPKLSSLEIGDVEAMCDTEWTRRVTDTSKIHDVKKKMENSVKLPQLDRIMKYISSRGCATDVSIVENLIDYVKEKAEMGASATELKKIFSHQTSLNLVDLLQFLCEIDVMLRTGITCIIFVHYEFQSEWLTESFTLTSEEKEIILKTEKEEKKKNLRVLIGEKIQLSSPSKVQLKPWTKLDGCVNDEVFHEWLCVILSRCIDFPSIPLTTLFEQFQYIKPIDVYFLLEVLQELGCVNIYLLNAIENNLLSKRRIVSECEATFLDSFEYMFVKPTNISCLCFGSFLHFLE